MARADDQSLASMRKWFPGWDNHALWCDPPRFAKIVKEGCWPLHPAATWFLYRLASVGKSLQQRSAVSLLEDALSQHRKDSVPDNQPWTLPAVTLCSNSLVNELIGAESYGQQAAIAHAFIAVRQRYEHNLSPQEDRLLRAILIASKVGLHVSDQPEANHAMALLAGTSPKETTQALQKLTSEYGVVGWNARFCQYEIIGDAVPRSAFDKWLRDQRRIAPACLPATVKVGLPIICVRSYLILQKNAVYRPGNGDMMRLVPARSSLNSISGRRMKSGS